MGALVYSAAVGCAAGGFPFFTASYQAFFATAFASLAAFFARISAQRFFVASIMFLRPSALSLRFFGAGAFWWRRCGFAWACR